MVSEATIVASLQRVVEREVRAMYAAQAEAIRKDLHVALGRGEGVCGVDTHGPAFLLDAVDGRPCRRCGAAL